ncbi:LysR substrate-binding domain-containing protein [Pontixanthobacter aquaemixtae]|uniref:LysR family transcriptional regulator n=1 Tax=Pontixanthobacter aquaemixtae TaxID=1958940 RepID=A0A844ZV25_9SPHN|nr:LysR substrate-binding domain-containing protein [Pontixanthobacter aquaemixtae]MXO91725.1 LysR family transcriptional regulator [Pontixanthobacter aquaemixtae]
MRRLPPTGALEAFLATARGGTLRIASEDLNLSVSALSRRIQALEAYVGQPLFARRHHEFQLTAAGKQLFSGMEPVFDQLSLLLEEVTDTNNHHLHIGVPSSFATAWLMPRLHAFRSRFPNVELHLDSSGSPKAKLGLSLDAIIYFANQDQQSESGNAFRPQRAFAVAAPGLVDIRLGMRKVLQEHTLLLHRGLPEMLPSWLQGIGLDNPQIKRIEHYDDGAMLVSAAENGLGIAVVLEDMVNFYPNRAKVTRPFGESAPTPYSYCLDTQPASGSIRALGWFREWVLEEALKDSRQLVSTAVPS